MKDKWQAGRMVVVRTDTASIKQINLPDGSVVWLNRSTKLTYPKKFSDAERLIKLDGEAFFDVSKNPDKPFVVKSDALTVKVLGTEFNFNGRKSVNMASVSLLAGSVRASGNHNEGLIVLSPNQKVVLNKLTGQMTVQLMNTKLDAVWHNNLIPFKNANINEIAKTLERFYKVRITVSSDIDKSITYSGVIEREDAIDSVLTVLSYTIPFKINIHGNDIQLSGCDR
jgi:ferric-dicitrate binding protein FerR (iron transport regulator)